jgi:1,4-alpha-glucan branching enzyme
MIKKTTEQNGMVRATFVLPYEDGQTAVSVVGDFNGWNPAVNKMMRRKNGTRSTSVVLEPGNRYRFRYFGADGVWFNDDAADAYEMGEHGSEDCVLVL